ncbi:HCO3 transporter family-domain-containing protein [Melanogaster broomeanus]|nr:HCO3 transporter family-domain-containing protein [Melanogaster broomeanus]
MALFNEPRVLQQPTATSSLGSSATMEPPLSSRGDDALEREIPGVSSAGASATLRNPASSWPLLPPFARRLGAGIVQDLRARAPWYISDWTDAWNYRVVPATALIFFANVLPGIAFSLDLIETTQQYGVAEVLMSSFMAAFIFSVFGAQPLTIAGVTGPITVFNKTIYDIVLKQPNAPNYLHFVGWVYLWAAIIHWITATLNWCNFLKYVTRFSCDTFGFYVSWVYLQYGVQVTTRQFSEGVDGAFVAVILALLMLVTSFLFQSLSEKTYFHRIIPANDRPWLVKFWELDGKWVGIALPFGIVLWILFFFDHNVSSLIAQGSQFPLRKPPGFHYDFFLLGITTFLAGVIGVPAPNGLIPQAPIHTTSLLIMGRPKKIDEEEQAQTPRRPSPVMSSRVEEKAFHSFPHAQEVPTAVVEQRVSNLAQGALCLVLLTGPFLHILNLIPRGVLAGLFWYMGADALRGNGITLKLLYLIRDKSLTPSDEPLRKVRKSRLVLFVAVQLIGFGATFAMTQTIAAIGFPVVTLLLVPTRILIIPRLPFTPEELSILDGPTASPFTMESVGGSL